MVKKHYSHNELKLVILTVVFDEYKTAQQITKELFQFGMRSKHWSRKYGNVCNRLFTLSRPVNPYTLQKWKPYLSKRLSKTTVNPATGRPVYEYRSSAKGRRMACELITRQSQGIPLKWDGQQRRRQDCNPRYCNSCPNKPGGDIDGIRNR